MIQGSHQRIRPSLQKSYQPFASTCSHSQHQRQQRQQKLFPLSALFFLLFILIITPKIVSSSSSTPKQQQPISNNLYHSVRELDKYGNSIQLRNAAECCNRYGSLVIAAIATSGGEKQQEEGEEGGIVVCTLRPHRPGVKIQKEEECVNIITSSDNISPSSSNNNHNDDGNSILVAHISSGLQPDSKLLLRLLRSYAKRWWDRYDAIPSIEVMADVTRAVKLGFMSYDDSGEISSLGIGPVIENDDEDEGGSSMSRPFGVSSLLLGVTSGDGYNKSNLKITSVAPNGSQKSWVARSIGRHSIEANSKLQIYWKQGMNVQQVREMCCKIMREVLLSEEEEEKVGGKSTSQTRLEKADIVCEILSAAGGKTVERIPLLMSGTTESFAAPDEIRKADA